MRHNHGESGSQWHSRGERWRSRSIGARIGIVAAGIVAVGGIFVLFGFIVVWLWNWLMPLIFRLPTIGFWEAWGLVILTSILFRGHLSPAHQISRDKRRKRALRARLHELGDEEAPESGSGAGPRPEGAV